MRAHLSIVSALAIPLLLTATSAEARPASTGIYAEAGLGGTGFLGEAGDFSKLGPSLGMRIGYDLFSWLSVGGYTFASTHEATVPAPPEGEYYQLYTAAADARLGFRVGWFAMYLSGGIGAGAISSNVLDKVGIVEPGQSYSFVLNAGGGFEYQLQNRHYAFGLDAGWSQYANFDTSQAVTVRTFLRYTY